MSDSSLTQQDIDEILSAVPEALYTKREQPSEMEALTTQVHILTKQFSSLERLVNRLSNEIIEQTKRINVLENENIFGE